MGGTSGEVNQGLDDRTGAKALRPVRWNRPRNAFPADYGVGQRIGDRRSHSRAGPWAIGPPMRPPVLKVFALNKHVHNLGGSLKSRQTRRFLRSAVRTITVIFMRLQRAGRLRWFADNAHVGSAPHNTAALRQVFQRFPRVACRSVRAIAVPESRPETCPIAGAADQAPELSTARKFRHRPSVGPDKIRSRRRGRRHHDANRRRRRDVQIAARFAVPAP